MEIYHDPSESNPLNKRGLNEHIDFTDKDLQIWKPSPASISPKSPVPNWGAMITVRFPKGTVQHPQLHNRISQEMGRACGTIENKEDLSIICDAPGDTIAEAIKDAQAMASRLLSILRLSPESYIACKLIPTDDSDQEPTTNPKNKQTELKLILDHTT
ncbi:hypothetical protein [Acidithrix ferrooxidans]|uniref:Uncharacterized protein n=1 Tax=Acidithrix ferrooxidans TaxID=1280514 RepID=A0A0D8HJY6_9ACTN|nr:hypothetical protein [Acidithrix ferrooxidans]KJF18062.1 hypothetical protein AXFE_11610 [Acidithrix ferrooxidans]